MNITDALASAAARLDAASVAEHRREAASLLEFTLGRGRTFLYAHPEYVLSDDEAGRFRSYVSRRAGREPYQYIVGRQEFYGLPFDVTPDVLIPRPETEVLVDAARSYLAGLASPRFLEIGVGSGCISVAVLHLTATSTAIAVDISADAITVARRNADANGVSDRLELRVSDLFSNVGEEKFDSVISNPPYIPAADIVGLQPEVGRFEPLGALTDGGDGLSLIRRIINEAPEHLTSGGLIALEFGFGQSAALRPMFAPDIWQDVAFIEDTNHIERVVTARLR